jgi:hypothetical protein
MTEAGVERGAITIVAKPMPGGIATAIPVSDEVWRARSRPRAGVRPVLHDKGGRRRHRARARGASYLIVTAGGSSRFHGPGGRGADPAS